MVLVAVGGEAFQIVLEEEELVEGGIPRLWTAMYQGSTISR